MMVFLNDRIPYGQDRDDQTVFEMATGPLGSIRFATAPGPADMAQEQLTFEDYDNASSSASVVKDPSKQYSCPA